MIASTRKFLELELGRAIKTSERQRLLKELWRLNQSTAVAQKSKSPKS
jgi:hypothetical protein